MQFLLFKSSVFTIVSPGDIPARRRMEIFNPPAYFSAGSVPGGQVVPDPNVSHYLFQSLLGAWPPGLTPDDRQDFAAFADRLRPAILKAAREAGERTSWTAPDPDFESALDEFVTACSIPTGRRHFWRMPPRRPSASVAGVR